jgi:hypothetical protein
MTWLDTINSIEDLPIGQLEPGRIIWLHGHKQSKTPGVFYAKAAEFAATPAKPWSSDNRFDEEAGFSAAELRVAIIGWRQQWFKQGAEGQPPQYLTGYEVGAKKNVEVLCLVEGLDDPMVLSVSGMNKAKPILDLIRSYEDGLLKQANRIARKSLPRWTFWLPIRSKEKDGKIAYIDATDSAGKSYGSVVTPPALFLPDDAMETCFVGEDILRRGAEVHDMYREWFAAKRLPQGVVEGEVIERLALPAPKNMPQPITEAELRPMPEVDIPDSSLPF